MTTDKETTIRIQCKSREKSLIVRNLKPGETIARFMLGLAVEEAEKREEEKNRDHRLADGSLSSEYKVGDRFKVLRRNMSFPLDSIVELYEDDGSDFPIFQIIGGSSSRSYVNWRILTPIKEQSK